MFATVNKTFQIISPTQTLRFVPHHLRDRITFQSTIVSLLFIHIFIQLRIFATRSRNKGMLCDLLGNSSHISCHRDS